jgi:hypothetical protein
MLVQIRWEGPPKNFKPKAEILERHIRGVAAASCVDGVK